MYIESLTKNLDATLAIAEEKLLRPAFNNDDFKRVKKQTLEAFDTDAAQVQARAYKLLADAYSELNKNDEAISYYQKAAHHFTDDTYNAAEYLFNAAGLSEKTGKTKEAIELYKEVKDKFPGTQQSSEADKYLAKLGVYN